MTDKPKTYPYEPDYVVAPGETLSEEIEYRGLSQRDLAVLTGLDEQFIHQIILGIQPITPETATKLEQALGTSAGLWINLESQYREALRDTLNHKNSQPEV